VTVASVTTPRVVVAEAAADEVPASWPGLDASLGVVATVASPSANSPGVLAHQVLRAVGVRPDVKGNADRQAHMAPGLAAVWLAAHRTEWLFLASPEHLSADTLETAVQLAAAGGARLMLGCDHGTAAKVTAKVQGWAPTPMTTAAAIASLRAGSPATPGTEQVEVGGIDPDDLPAADFYAFRSECRRTLPPGTFARVDALYLAARDAARRLADHDWAPEAVDALVLRLLWGRPGLADGVVVVRGIQAGAFREGVLVKADHARLVAALASEDRRPFDDAQWNSLRAWRQPVHASVVALHQADAPPSAMLGLTVADATEAVTAAEGKPFKVKGHLLDPRARPFLAALSHWRLRSGADDTDTLFPDLTTAGVARCLREARTELGLPVAEQRVEAGSRRGARWTTAMGLSVHRLPGAQPSSTAPPAARQLPLPTRTPPGCPGRRAPEQGPSTGRSSRTPGSPPASASARSRSTRA